MCFNTAEIFCLLRMQLHQNHLDIISQHIYDQTSKFDTVTTSSRTSSPGVTACHPLIPLPLKPGWEVESVFQSWYQVLLRWPDTQTRPLSRTEGRSSDGPRPTSEPSSAAAGGPGDSHTRQTPWDPLWDKHQGCYKVTGRCVGGLGQRVSVFNSEPHLMRVVHTLLVLFYLGQLCGFWIHLCKAESASTPTEIHTHSVPVWHVYL